MSRPASQPKKKRLTDGFLKGSGWGALVAYLGIRSLLAVIQVFPLKSNLESARFIAGIWNRMMPRHRRHARAHLQEAFGNRYTDREIDEIADASMESVIMFAMELVCLPRRVHALTWSRYIELVDFDEALRVLLHGRGAILVTGHYGSFEIMGHLLSALGFDMVAVMRPIDNDYINQFVVASRKTHGLTLLDKKGAAASAEEHLRSGSLVGFIGDQDAGRKGMFVDFFGKPASTYKSIGLLAMAINVPIIIGFARRMGGHPRYQVGVQRVLYPADWENQGDPLHWITQAYTSAIEEIVRADPRQYLWIHRRWKSQPRARKATVAPPAALKTG